MFLFDTGYFNFSEKLAMSLLLIEAVLRVEFEDNLLITLSLLQNLSGNLRARYVRTADFILPDEYFIEDNIAALYGFELFDL